MQTIVLLVFCQLLIGNIVTAQLELTIRARVLPIQNTIRLTCENGVQSDLEFQRVLGSSSSSEDFQTFNNGSEVSFDITPETEGRYRCRNQTSVSQDLVLVAFPSPDSMLVQETSTPVRAMLAQTSPPLKCVYQKGQLSQYYSLQWFKGNILLANTAENNTNPHFSINEDYSLIIHDVVSSDAGSGYYCRVTVTDPNTGFNETATGLNIQLIVIVNITINEHLTDKSVHVGDSVRYQCSAVSLPAPVITWTVNGVPITVNNSNYQLTSSTSTPSLSMAGVSVTSVFNINNVLASITVTCVTTTGNSNTDYVRTSTSMLTVITNSLKPNLATDSRGVVLTVALQETITPLFYLNIVFTSAEGSTHSLNLTDPSFILTKMIEVAIPFDKIPEFQMFQVSVAVVVNGVIGSRSEQSNQISIERPTDVTTTAEPTKETFTPYIIIIIILVVLCIIFASLLIVALMVQCCRQKSVLSPTPEYGPHVDLTQYNDQRETRVDGTNSSTSRSSRSSESLHSHTPGSMDSCTEYSGRSRSSTPNRSHTDYSHTDCSHTDRSYTKSLTPLFDDDIADDKTYSRTTAKHTQDTATGEDTHNTKTETKSKTGDRKASNRPSRTTDQKMQSKSALSPSHAASMPLIVQEQKAVSTPETSLTRSIISASTTIPHSEPAKVDASTSPKMATASAQTGYSLTASQIVKFQSESKGNAQKEKKESQVMVTTQKMDSNEGSNEEEDYLCLDFVPTNQNQ